MNGFPPSPRETAVPAAQSGVTRVQFSYETRANPGPQWGKNFRTWLIVTLNLYFQYVNFNFVSSAQVILKEFLTVKMNKK